MPPLFHTCFFLDDSYFFFKACLEYEDASSQRINLQKSTVSFSPNVPEATKLELCSILGMTNSGLVEKYLGVPIIIGRNKKAIF